LIEQFFLPFIATYLRDIKCEAFSFMATSELTKALNEIKINVTPAGQFELNKLTKE